MSRYSHFFVLFNQLEKLGYTLDRQEVIGVVTGGKKFSLTKLSGVEYHAVISHLKHLLHSSNPDGDTPEKEAENRMRRKIIALFRKMGYEKDGKADMKSLYGWVISRGKFHKPLNTHSYVELTALVCQTELMYKSYVKEINNERAG